MTTVSNDTISKILEATLDIGSDTAEEAKSSGATKSVSAASILLAEKKKLRDLPLGDFVPIVATSSTSAFSPFFDQIASSKQEIQSPTYWKSDNSKKSKVAKSKQQPMSKAKSKGVKKGEDYQDRLKQKQFSKIGKKGRLEQLKNLY